MKKVDIEKLLQWALREELPKGRPVSLPSCDLISDGKRLALGTRVQSSPDGLGLVPGVPHPDAAVIAGAIRGLPSQVSLSCDECAALVAPYHAISGFGEIALLSLRTYDMQTLLIRSAVIGQRLAWEMPPPRPRPVKHATGGWPRVFAAIGEFDELVEVFAHRKRGYSFNGAPRSQIVWQEPSLSALLVVRASYAIWYRGLIALMDLIGHRLSEHVPTGPMAAAEPWRTGQPPAPVVLQVAGGNLAKVRLKPERKRALMPLESHIERMARARTQKRSRKRRAKASETLGGCGL